LKGEKRMELKKVWAVYYSATGTTAKVVRTAAEALAEDIVTFYHFEDRE
jgi:flavodoxin